MYLQQQFVIVCVYNGSIKRFILKTIVLPQNQTFVR
jgi:hypothetical protein